MITEFYKSISIRDDGIIIDNNILDAINSLDVANWHLHANITVSDIRNLAMAIFVLVMETEDVAQLLTSNKNLCTLNITPAQASRGIHALRAYMAKYASIARRLEYDLNQKEYSRVNNSRLLYDALGIVAITNFAGLDVANYVLDYIKKYNISASKNDINMLSNSIHKPIIVDLAAKIHDIVVDCCANNKEVGHQFVMNTFFQRIQNSQNDNDVQKRIHSDTYFSALKFWYFPEEVTLEDGPFEYVIGSHALNLERLKWIHEQSMSYYDGSLDTASRTYGHAEGSLTVFPEEIRRMNYPNITPITVKADTLVIANVFGFHARGNVIGTRIRNSIHGSIRFENPFD